MLLKLLQRVIALVLVMDLEQCLAKSKSSNVSYDSAIMINGEIQHLCQEAVFQDAGAAASLGSSG